MNEGPPLALERIVGILLPPAVREVILGDLWERYRTPVRYLIDALCILPFLIASQLRRSTSFDMTTLLAFTLFASMGGFGTGGAPAGLPVGPAVLVATLVAITALLARNVYRAIDAGIADRTLGDALTILLSVAASQVVIAAMVSAGLLSTAWRVPVGMAIGGMLFSTVVLLFLRSGFEVADARRSGPRGQSQTLGIEMDYERFRHAVGFRNAVEACALGLLLMVAGWFCFTARPLVALLGFGWIALMLPLLWRMAQRARVPAMHASLPAAGKAALYRSALVRQRDSAGRAWWCYFGPLFAGFGLTLVFRGILTSDPEQVILGILCMALLGLLIARADRDRRQRLDERIGVIDRCAFA